MAEKTESGIIDESGNAGGDVRNDAIDIAVAETIAGIETADPRAGKPKRGRPHGSGTKTSAGNAAAKQSAGKTTQNALGGIEKILFSIHQMAAAFVAPELALSESESKELTQALAEVNNFYSQVIDPKVIAWAGLIGVCGKIYGPRVGALIVRKQAEKSRQQKTQPVAQPINTPQQKQNITPQIKKTFENPEFISVPDFE